MEPSSQHDVSLPRRESLDSAKKYNHRFTNKIRLVYVCVHVINYIEMLARDIGPHLLHSLSKLGTIEWGHGCR